MTRTEFTEVLKGGLPDQQLGGHVSEFVKSHPFCDIARLAELRCLKIKKDLSFESALQTAAIHLPDRRILKNWVEQEVARSQINVPVLEPSVEVNESPTGLESQYLTAAIQSSISLEVDEGVSEDEERLSPNQEHDPPTNFLDFITGGLVDSETTDRRIKSDKLIQSFLKNEPREKVSFFDPVKMAKESLDDSEGVVTDTLARIYLNQGNYAKALAAYEQLRLNYPSKSSYFAARIEKVKGLIEQKR